MLSTRLISVIEDDAEQLTRSLIRQLKTHPQTPLFRQFSDMEIHRRVCTVYSNLAAWLGGRSREEICRHYTGLGARRFEEEVPLREVIYALILCKKNLLTYVKNHGLGIGQDLFAETDLVQKMDQFWDDAIYYTAAGYEEAMLAGPHTLAAAG